MIIQCNSSVQCTSMYLCITGRVVGSQPRPSLCCLPLLLYGEPQGPEPPLSPPLSLVPLQPHSPSSRCAPDLPYHDLARPLLSRPDPPQIRHTPTNHKHLQVSSHSPTFYYIYISSLFLKIISHNI